MHSPPPTDVGAVRLCPLCNAASAIDPNEAVFPSGWKCSNCEVELESKDRIILTAPDLADMISGFDPADFAFLAQAERNHFWFAARRRLICGLVDCFFPEAARFLEVGCGSGNVIEAVAQLRAWDRIVGTEIHTSGLALARERLPSFVELIQVDARRMPLRSLFDLAGAFDVLEHIDADEEAIQGIYGALQPGGGFIATVPQHPWLWSVSDDIAHHERRYVSGQLESKLERAGFTILFSTSYTVSLLPLMALNRMMARRAKPLQDPRELARREFHVSPLVNSVLTSVLNKEVAMTLRGMRWPVGGSRVVVARKL